MSLQYIIDGYNIINHPLFSKRSNKKIHDRRKALLDLIKINRLSGSAKNKVTVVFDGYPSPEDAQELSGNTEGISVVFSRSESADEKIKRIVESYGNPKNIIVVSDDKQIQSAVKSLNASVSAAQDFIAAGEKQKRNSADEPDTKVNYSQMQRINQELRKLWLK